MKDYEGTVLFWFLPSSAEHQYNLDNFHALKTIINDVRICDENDTYADQLTSLTDETVFVILESGCTKLLDDLLLLQSIRFIYLREPCHHPQTLRIRGVFRDEHELRVQLQKDVKMAMESGTHLCIAANGDLKRSHTSFQNLQNNNENFIFLQYLLQIILAIQGPKENGHHDLIEECRLIYQDNPKQISMINEFEQDYEPDYCIWWYTRDSFLYKMINQALRTENIAIIWKFRFFIRDLYHQLKNLNGQQKGEAKDSKSHQYNVYRGQQISLNEHDELEKSVGGRFGTNSFLSTSRNPEVARIFAGNNSAISDYKPAIFEISIDEEELANDYLPFADISGMSNFGSDEGEVLLCMGTIMEIKCVELIDGVVWIRLRMCQSDNSFHDQSFLNLVRQAMLSDWCDELYFLYIGVALMVRGEYTKAEQVMNQMKPTGISLIDTYRQILLNALHNLKLSSSDSTHETGKNMLQDFYKLSLSALEKTELPDNGQTAIMHRLEQEYSLVKNSDFTLSSLLENQLPDSNTTEFIPQMHNFNDLSLIANISDRLSASVDGPLYSGTTTPTAVLQILVDYAIEKGNFDQAIQFAQEILSKSCSEDDGHNACKKLAWLYEKQGNISASIECLRKFISQSEFSPNSLDKVSACISCGDLYMKTNDHSPAFLLYKQALDIVQQHYPADHSFIGRIFIKMGNYFSKTSDIQSAIEYYDRVIKLGQSETMSEAYRSIGIIHSNETYDLAREYFIKSMNIEENQTPLNLFNLSYLYKLLIELEHRNGNHEQRDIYVDRLLKLATNNESFQDSIMETIQTVLQTIG